MNKKKIIACGCSSTIEALSNCPSCNKKGIKVTEETLNKHLKKEHYLEIKSNKTSFNFCTSPSCNTVYYSNERTETFSEKMVKHKIAAKNQDLDTPLCYCKRFSKQDAIDVINSGEKDVSKIILNEIGDNCKCSKTNPKGVSCVEDIRNFLIPYGIEFSTSKSTSSCCITENDTSRSYCGTTDNEDINFMKSVVKSNGGNVTFSKMKNNCC